MTGESDEVAQKAVKRLGTALARISQNMARLKTERQPHPWPGGGGVFNELGEMISLPSDEQSLNKEETVKKLDRVIGALHQVVDIYEKEAGR